VTQQKKGVIVTGAGSGIGKATARRFGDEGYGVICGDILGADATAQQIRDEGKRATAVTLDVRFREDWLLAVAQAEREFGGVDVLANIAGVVSAATDTVVDQDEAGWQRVLDVDLKGVWLGMRAVIPGMLARGGGRIINVTSIAGMIGLPNLAAYSAAKGGVIALSRQAAVQYAAGKVQVNAIAPGIIRTPILSDVTDALRDALEKSTPLGRMGEADEIASMVVHLAGSGGSFITGQVFAIDGGWTSQ
jgi:NAD(P)-dependent dehydrogenase (short-subunit alcohol dehydrogenase family)